jgi:adenylate kinase
LVKVSVRDLLKAELRENPDNGKIICKCIDNGEPVPDNIINSLVEARLKQSDCRVNGWVMDGFPESEPQINLLKAMRIRPSAVFILEQAEEESVRRLANRRMDPNTGIQYNLEVNPPSDEATVNRLIEAPEDKYPAVKARYAEWGK